MLTAFRNYQGTEFVDYLDEEKKNRNSFENITC